MQLKAISSAVLLLLASLSACGYIQHGSKQKVFVDTVPSGAKVDINGVIYTSPIEVELNRNIHHTVMVRTPSGASEVRHIQSNFQLQWQVLDLFLLPIIGNMIDGFTGGDSELSPTELTIPVPQ